MNYTPKPAARNNLKAEEVVEKVIIELKDQNAKGS
jgi:hypothetical protein